MKICDIESGAEVALAIMTQQKWKAAYFGEIQDSIPWNCHLREKRDVLEVDAASWMGVAGLIRTHIETTCAAVM